MEAALTSKPVTKAGTPEKVSSVKKQDEPIPLITDKDPVLSPSEPFFSPAPLQEEKQDGGFTVAKQAIVEEEVKADDAIQDSTLNETQVQKPAVTTVVPAAIPPAAQPMQETPEMEVPEAEVTEMVTEEAVTPNEVADTPALPGGEAGTGDDATAAPPPADALSQPLAPLAIKGPISAMPSGTSPKLITMPQDGAKRDLIGKSLVEQSAAKKAESTPAPAAKAVQGVGNVNIPDVSRKFLANNPQAPQGSGQTPAFRPQAAPSVTALKGSGKSVMEQARTANGNAIANAGKQADAAMAQNKNAAKVKPTIKATPINTGSILDEKGFDPIPDKLESLPGYKEAVTPENKVLLDEKLAPKLQEERQAQENFAAQQADAKTNTDARINNESAAVRQRQVQQQASVKTEITGHKNNWKKETDAVKSGYDKDAKGKKDAVGKDIEAQVSTADSQIKDSYDTANRQAGQETARVKREEAAKRAEAQKKSKDKSLWDKAVDFVSDIFDQLKKALNALFDKLKAFVKRAIDAAKALANKVIDKLRDGVKALIRGFGEALKAIANVALAMFPKLRDKFNRFIDNAVNKALTAVDALAESLKKTVNMLLDALGKVITALLSAAQAFYNAILDVCKFLTIGLIKIAQFLFTLNMAAYQSGAEFFGALAEESLGGNPAEPLQDVEVPLGQEKQWAAAMGLSTDAVANTDGEDPMPEVLTKPVLSDNDVTTDPYPAVELDKSFLASLPPLKEGEKLELGGSGNPVTTKQLQESVINGGEVAPTTPEDMQAAPEQGGGTPKPDWRHMTDEQKLNEYTSQMLDTSKETGTEKPTPTQATPQPEVDNSPEALVTKTGRLGAGRRLAYMGEQMMAGIQALWNQYKVWIIAGLIAALIVIAAILFFSGGTALGLVVQAIGEALILIFGAIAVARSMGSIWDYVKKSWAGDTKGAAKALAMAFAIIVVEFLLDKILLGMGKVFKRILKSAKATKVGRFVTKGLETVGKARRYVSTSVRSGMAALRNSKIVIFLEKIVSRGAGKLDDLRNKILSKFGFKRMWFERHGDHMQLWGEFNSKVLLSDTEVDGVPVERKLHDVDDSKIWVDNGKTYAEIDGVVHEVERVYPRQMRTTHTTDPSTNLSRRKNYVSHADGTESSVTLINKHGVNEDHIDVFPNGRAASNARKYAGKEFPLPDNLRKYGDSVPFTKEGYADFETVLARKGIDTPEVKIKMSGDSAADIRKANEEIFNVSTTKKSVQEGFENYTWHHSPDGETMILVPTDLHNYVRHYGGDAITRARLELDIP